MSERTDRRLVLGTRGSPLAWTQSNLVKSWLEAKSPGLEVEMRIVKTEGDRLQEAPPAPGERLEKGLFTSALERALLSSEIDLAVHSLKDLPTRLDAGLVVAAIPLREDPRDVLVTNGPRWSELPPGARIATGSPRRRLQLLVLRPDLRVEPVRGNVDTRIGKVRSGEFDGVVLAYAGMARLGRVSEITEPFDWTILTPAPGQGALAIETREGDVATLVARLLDHQPTRAAVTAERAVLAGIGGGCNLPLGAYARADEQSLALDAILFSADGKRFERASARGVISSAAALGESIAKRLEAALGTATS